MQNGVFRNSENTTDDVRRKEATGPSILLHQTPPKIKVAGDYVVDHMTAELDKQRK